MRQDDTLYQYLLDRCQSPNLKQRLEALDDLRRYEYVHLLEPQFLLDRLNSTSHWQEQKELLGLMYSLKKPLPISALMAILEDWETSSTFLRMDVAHTLALVQAEEALDLYLQVLLDRDEHPWLRETMTGDLPLWGERVSDELVLSLLHDPARAVCMAALEVVREWPAQRIPFELVVPFCTHADPSVREDALKTLVATKQVAAIAPILAALDDPEPRVRAAASHCCMALSEHFGDQMPLEPLVQGLSDEDAAVREDCLDALAKTPHRAPVELVIAALNDPVSYVRCAAIELLGLLGERVPTAIYPRLQHLANSDDAAHVRQRATRTLLLLHGMTPPPLRLPTIDLTLEDLEKRGNKRDRDTPAQPWCFSKGHKGGVQCAGFWTPCSCLPRVKSNENVTERR